MLSKITWKTFFGFIFGSLFLLILFTPCQWQLMDDASSYAIANSYLSADGYLLGSIHFLEFFSKNDYSLGVIRPSYGIYELFIYGFNHSERLAYLIRLFMLAVSVLAPILWIQKQESFKKDPRRNTFLILCLASLFASYAFWDGLIFISLQELSAIFSVALIFFILPKRLNAASWKTFLVSGFLICMGAFFKAPMFWVLPALVVFWLVLNKKTIAALSVVSGISLLAMFVLVSRHGSYTHQMYAFTVHSVLKSFENFLFFGKYTLLILFGSLFILRPKTSFHWQRFLLLSAEEKVIFALGISLFCGGGLYLVNLVLWGGALYHWAPALWLGSLGAFIALSVLSPFTTRLKPKYEVALIAILALVCMRVVFNKAKYFYQINTGIESMTTWMKTLPIEDEKKVCTTGIEMAVTIPELMDIKSPLGSGQMRARLEDANPTSPDLNRCTWIIVRDENSPLASNPEYSLSQHFGAELFLFQKK